MGTVLIKKRVRYSAMSWFLTVFAVVLLGCIGFDWINYDALWEVLTFWLCVVSITVPTLWYAPLSVSVTASKGLVVRRPLTALRIPSEMISSVRRCPPTMGAMRICGSGGFMGYWGWFRERDLGRYFAYYGKSSDCFLVTLTDGRKYMIGCEAPDEILNQLAQTVKKP